MRYEHFDTLDSTSSEARRRATAGDHGPLWIQADSQSGGRGRLGREWISRRGNLYCTGLYPHDGPMAQAGLLSFCAANAVADLIKIYCPDTDTRLKWPNDVQIKGAKLAGILLESVRGWVSVGIGINIHFHPDDLPYPATHLAAHMDIDDPEEIPDARAMVPLLSQLFEQQRDILRREGFMPIRKAWLARAAHLGQKIETSSRGQAISGMMEGLANDGALVLRLPDGGIARISSGEVFSVAGQNRKDANAAGN
ncbi:biotin--[acetyl-CoA-carboxylase] ligase [Robiginitomaculum antarcticum]|uniref:biotin--[acetyl-CoA-carboxylase] ligase n=1 Tax=Robiginitomaculum antarcticum TaxID=437507 RepID=UPI000377EC8E|nr:biotin--[acetyl-CoA-carboxylase] ligase [Robiginitomaculum antarcticum]